MGGISTFPNNRGPAFEDRTLNPFRLCFDRNDRALGYTSVTWGCFVCLLAHARGDRSPTLTNLETLDYSAVALRLLFSRILSVFAFLVFFCFSFFLQLWSSMPEEAVAGAGGEECQKFSVITGF